MPRRKVLVLTSRYPFPVVGGDRLRLYYLCRELSKDYDLTLCSLCENRHEMEISPPPNSPFQRIERVLLPRWRSILNTAIALPTRTPLQVAYYRSANFRRLIDELLPEHDACLAHLVRTGDYVRHAAASPRLLEMTDAISLNYTRVKALRSTRNLKALVYAFEARRLKEYEMAVLDDFDAVSLISDTDRAFLLEGLEKPNVFICSNGVDLSQMPFTARQAKKPIIVFIGNMTTVQNLDACQYFIDMVLPLLHRKLDVVFRIVGRINGSEAERLSRFSNVEVTGEVPSISSAVADAWLGACPMRIGAGVQNKVLEYMALGLPVISSPIGAEGLGVSHGKDILIAQEAEDYAEAIMDLWRTPQYARTLAEAGRHYVEQEHDWSTRCVPLRSAVARIIR